MSPQLLAWLTALSFAASNVSVRRGFAHSTPLTATFVSLLVHTVVLWTVLLTTTGIPEPNWTALAAIGLTGLIQPAMRHCHYTGIHKIGTGRAVTLRNTYPIFTVAVGILVLGEPATAAGLIGTALIIVGVVLTSWRIDQHLPAFRWSYLLYPFATVLLTALVHPLRRFALTQSHEPLFFTAVIGPISLLAFGVYYALPICGEKLVWDRRAVKPILLSGAFETLAVLLMLFAFSRGPVVVVSPITATAPIWTVILAAIFLREFEHVTPASVLGTICVVAGVIAVSLA
ncbi:MAG TPA: DMT family transporter [candidate division Zixibacteria bacterium]|nr:DMT family transporter [candidate division Zixibacteria bacterium]